jgi:hypothetical protein
VFVVEFESLMVPGSIVNRYSFTDGDTAAIDSVGGKDGTLEGTATISGNKLVLDGAGAAWLPSDTLDPGLESVTIEAWYTENETGDIWTRLFDFGGTAEDGGGGYAMFCVPHQYGSTRFTVATNGFATWQTGEETVSGPIFTGEQTHVACVWDGPGAEIKIYLNGVLQQASATTMDLSAILRENAYIGDSCYTPDPYMTGTVDEFRIYNAALTDAEVLTSFLAGPDAEVPIMPTHSYTFEDGTANDSIGGADGVLVGGAAIVGGALVTTAQDQWMEMPGDVIAMNTYEAVTIEAFYTPTAGANASWSMLAYFGDSTDPDPSAGVGNDGFFITSARGDDKSRAAISIGDPASPWASETGADGPEYDDGLAHYMASTINATDITLYIDGALIASTPLAAHNSIAGISTNYALLAKGGYGGDPEWIGEIEEFNIYNKALSAADIAASYAAGPNKVGAQPVDPGTDGLLAYYPLDSAGRSITKDASGNANDGTIVGDPVFIADGVVGNALDFDGAGDYVDCGSNPLFGMQETNQITVATWLTIRSVANQWGAAVAKGENAWRLGNVSLDPRFHFGITIWNAPDTASVDGVTAVGFDEWHHVAGTFDGANISVYLDGVVDATAATTVPIGTNALNVFIGDNPEATGRFWDGAIDEVYIYNRALSDLEIQFLAGL